MARCLSQSPLPLFGLPLLALVYGCAQPTSSGPAVVFDACQALSLAPSAGATEEETAGLRAAAALWNDAAHAHLTVVDEAAAPSGVALLPVRFQAAAALSHGFYDAPSGQVFINTDLQQPSLAIAIAHEVGHAFGLVHVSPDLRESIMNPGNLDLAPTPDDVGALTILWGRCPDNSP